MKEMLRQLHTLCSFSKKAILVSLWTAIFLLFLALIFRSLAFGGEYLRYISAFHSALQAAPQTVLCGTLGALICDLIARKTQNQD